MRKRYGFILAAVVVAVVGGVIWWAVAGRSTELVYDGKPLSYWIDTGIAVKAGSSLPVFMAESPASIDSNAVPYLLETLRKHDSSLRKGYNNLWRDHLPDWLRYRLPYPNEADIERRNSCLMLGGLSTAARVAIPEITRLMRQDENEDVRIAAAQALGRIASFNDKMVTEALVAATNDENSLVRQSASEALMRLDPKAAADAGMK